MVPMVGTFIFSFCLLWAKGLYGWDCFADLVGTGSCYDDGCEILWHWVSFSFRYSDILDTVTHTLYARLGVKDFSTTRPMVCLSTVGTLIEGPNSCNISVGPTCK